MTTNLVSSSELEVATAFIEAHPQVEVIEVMISDTNGVLRGKWLSRGSFTKVFKSGMCLPLSTFALDIWGQEVAASGLMVANTFASVSQQLQMLKKII